MKRARARTWLFALVVANSAMNGGSGFSTSAVPILVDRSFASPTLLYSSGSSSTSSRSSRSSSRRHGSRTVAGVIFMKQKISKNPATVVRTRRAGPRTDAEGYSQAAFLKMRNEVTEQVATHKPGTRSRRPRKINFSGNLDSCPCLVLNADYQPLSYLPLSLWGWQDVIKAVFSEKVVVLATYGDRCIRSPSIVVPLPSVIALKEFVNNHRNHPPFTRRNLFLRDSHQCQYCLKYFAPHNLSFDHVVPKKLGGKAAWDNVVTACGRCNNRKSDCHPRDLRKIGMSLAKYPQTPSFSQLQNLARRYPPAEIHETWEDYLYFESEIVGDEEEELGQGEGEGVGGVGAVA